MGHTRLFNEWHGQAEGDRVLADVGTVLKDIENAGDGRRRYWGQDDFCILIPLSTTPSIKSITAFAPSWLT